jgi:hypothetical protein
MYRRVNIITTRDVEPLIRTIFQQTLLGPETIDFPHEYSEEVPRDCYPDLLKEASFFKVTMHCLILVPLFTSCSSSRMGIA